MLPTPPLVPAPRVIAHRGASARAPENTLAALELALAAGADMIEVDVTRSRDFQLLLIHDAELGRTTDGQGRVLEKDWRELRRLDAGSWKAPRYAGEKLPRLAEALELVRGRVPLQIEIKPEAIARPSAGLPALDPGGFEERLIAVVRDLGMLDEVVVSSFHPLALWRLNRLEPRLALASLLHRPYHGDRVPHDVVAEVGASALHLADSEVSAGHIADCRAHRLPWRVYTVNGPERFRELAALGTDGVFTDQVERLLALRDGRPDPGEARP